MRFEPHNYQSYSIQKVIDLPRVGLFLDMGLGKSVITLSAIMELMFYRFEIAKVLIIAPKKVAEATWTAEAQKWDHTQGLRISLVLGSEKKRIKALCTPADVYVINRENVVWLVDYYRQDWPFDMIVIDESSSFKSPKAKRFKALSHVAGKSKRIVELTGTPSPNSLMDLWAQIYLLDGGERLGERFTHFRERYFDAGPRINGVVYKFTAKRGSQDSVLAAISDICVSMKAEDYLELPDMVEHDIPVALDSKAARAYTELERQMVLDLPDGEISVTNAAALSTKLLQLANGAVYDEDQDYHKVHDCKLDALEELIEQLNGRPALVFYNFRHDMERILNRLDGVRLLQDDQDIVDWNEGKIDILLAHPASGAYGLNLQEGGNHVIWFGLTWNYEQYVQANARLHRQGQAQTVIVHRLICQDTRDEDVIGALARKENAQEYVMQTLKARVERIRKETA